MNIKETTEYFKLMVEGAGAWELCPCGKEDMEMARIALEALEKQTPKKPIEKAMQGFDPGVASHLACPTCGEPVTNYWAPGVKPAHCQFCGQALDWEVVKK